MSVNMEQFKAIVRRDLRKQATEDEQKFLRSSPEIIKLWDSTLTSILMDLQSRLAHLRHDMLEEQQVFIAQGPSAKNAWFLRKKELDEQRTSAIHLQALVQKKKQEVSLILKEQGTEKVRTPQEMRRADIRKGYSTCLHHLHMLLEEQFTYSEADDFLKQFIELYLKPWEIDLSQGGALHELLKQAIRESIEK